MTFSFQSICSKTLFALFALLALVGSSLFAKELTQQERNEIAAKLVPVITMLLDDSTITHNGITYGLVTSPYTAHVWLDRNLGASRVCTAFDDMACFGDYYQWGRNTDGHKKSGSTTTTTLATYINSVGAVL
ncbi:MAG: hypothetical protein ACWA5P_02275 [bacterium]